MYLVYILTFLSLSALKCYAVTSREEPEERAYLNLMDHIIKNGQKVEDRTGTGTMSLFAPDVLKFTLTDGRLPILTTKKMSPRLAFEETAFFLRGDTNTNHLSAIDVNIWKLNTSRDFLDQRGLQHLKVGDLGASYPHQWRHQGAEYVGMDADYSGQGNDQIAELLHLLEEEPNTRRALVVSWNPSQLDQMALPPCHFAFQCRRYHDHLHMHVNLRSNDQFLGAPFNILGYAFMLHMFAHVLHLEPGHLSLSSGDAHVYLNHVQVAKKQISRVGFSFPKITIKTSLTGDPLRDLLRISWADIQITGYESHGPLKAQMAV